MVHIFKNSLRILFSTCLFYLLVSCGSGGSDNPLLRPTNEYIDFARITANHVSEARDLILNDARMMLDKLVNIPDEERNFENTLLARDDIEAKVWHLWNPVQLLAAVHPDEAVCTASDSAIILLSQFHNTLNMDRSLFLAIEAYSKSAKARELTGWKEKYLDDLLADFKRSGIALPDNKRQKVRAIKDRLSDWSLKFGNNIFEFSDTLFVTEKEIAGLPESYVQDHLTKSGNYAIDLTYPSYFPFMTLSESNNARRRLFIKYNNRATDQNLKLLRVILRDRKKLAVQLGYDSYADLNIDDKMARSADSVWKFEHDLVAALGTKAESEYRELLDIKSRASRKPADQIFGWEKLYYTDQLAKSKYHLDNEVIREYFSTDLVISGLIDLLEELFQLSIIELENEKLWHPDVRLFEVTDNKTRKWIGSFYLDLYPRPDKYSHAACFDVNEGKQYPGSYQKPMFALVCNFAAPGITQPSLLSHNQVQTLFHEFGHGIHNLLTEAELISQAGTRVEQDFVETPSQVLEAWSWEKSVLKRFAKHYRTGEIIPDELLDKLISAKNMTVANNNLQQAFYGQLDLMLHDTYNPFGAVSTTDIVKQLQNKLTNFPYVPDTHMEASFNHLIGYGAGYYGYLWSEVYAKDIFSVFRQNGVFDQSTASLLREKILARGGTEKAAVMIRDFLGREPGNKAFINDMGL